MTGASSGVVAGIARRVVEAGAAVVVHYRSDADGAAAVVDAIGAAGSRAIAASAELLDRAAEPTRFRRYGIGSPMLDDCCWATRPPAAPVSAAMTPEPIVAMLDQMLQPRTWPRTQASASGAARGSVGGLSKSP